MTDKSLQLSWEDLRRVEGDLPWTALEIFADAVAADATLARELFAEYDKAWQAVDVPTYVDLYVPAIFALAAPKLDDQQRRAIGSLLVDRLLKANTEGADMNEQTLLAACGSMGPVILPTVLDRLEATTGDPESDASSWVWNLTPLAGQTEDAALRDRTIRACVRLLEQIDRGEVEEYWGVSAAWTLARLKYTEAGPLLQRLDDRFRGSWKDEEYGEAREFLEGRPGRVTREEPWQQPVQKWLELPWQARQKWDLRHRAAGPGRTRELIDRFMASPQAQDLPEGVAEDAPYITQLLLDYAHTHEEAIPEELTESVVQDLLLDVFPRKVSAEREFFEKAPVVVESFLRWMASDGILPEGHSTADAVRGWAQKSVSVAMDSDNWGPAKRLTMGAKRAGVDTTDQEAMLKYMTEQTEKARARLAEGASAPPPIPIVEHSPKTGRNDPCPCGSGKKYKKCCGNPAQSQSTGI